MSGFFVANTANAAATYTFTVDPTSQTITKSVLVPETSGVPTGGNDAVTAAVSGLTPIKVTLTSTGDASSSDHVRLIPINAGSNIQFWTKDTAGNWYDINVKFWDSAQNIPMSQILNFPANVFAISDEAGSYPWTINLVLVSDPSPIASIGGTITVVAPILTLTANPTSQTITKSVLVLETSGVPTGGNDAVTAAVSGLTPIAVTLENTGGAASANVRISPIGADSHIQLWAKDSLGNWFDVNVTGWGPGGGFPVPANSGPITTNVYAISDLAGSYLLTANLVDAVFSALITSATGTVTVNQPAPAATTPSLGTASDFAALGTAVTLTNSIVTGNVGSIVGTVTNTGSTVNGTIYAGGAQAVLGAHADFLSAYGAVEVMGVDEVLTGTLAGVTLIPGVYSFDIEAKTGTLTLDAQGNPDAVWIFKSANSTGYLEATNFHVFFLGGVGSARNVFWWTDAYAAVTTSDFQGTILSGTYVTVTGGTLTGRALATDAVTITNNTVTAPGTVSTPFTHTQKTVGTWVPYGIKANVTISTVAGKFHATEVPGYTLVYYPNTGAYDDANYTGLVYPVEGTNMNLPMPNDLNGSSSSTYCTIADANGNKFNPHATVCQGAKLWLIPAGSFTDNGNGTYTIDWGKANTFLFETGLINYTPDITPPVITRIGDATVNLTVGDSYTDAGATALDDINGDITSNIVTVNPVNIAVIGVYTVTYNVSDVAGNPAVEVTRTVNIVAAPAPAPALVVYGGGGGGGGGGGWGYVPITTPTPTPIVGQVLGATTFSFANNLGLGSRGDVVTELQKRLTDEGVYSGPITGYFGQITLAGVKAYQKKYDVSQTGFVGPLTRAQLNASQVAGASTVNVEAIRTQIVSLQAQVVVLLQQLLQMLQTQVKQ